jgi:YVTN family beta-propeller protein
MSRGRAAVLSLVLAGVLLAALPALAGARSSYVTGSSSESAEPFAVPVDLATQAPGAEVPLPGGGEGAPSDVAISPNGATAWVPNLAAENVVPIDVASNTAGTPVALPEPYGVAISPDGSRVYVSDRGGAVYAIDTATNTIIAGPIAVGNEPVALAVTPDGSRVYVANRGDDTVDVIDTATNTVVAGPIAVGNNPEGLAVTPNGSRVYVVDSGLSEDVRAIDTATNTVVATIPSVEGRAIAISPDGTRAYAVGIEKTTPIALAPNTADAPIAGGDFLSDVAILPNGSTAYVVSSGNVTSGLLPIDLAANTASSVFPVGDQPEAIAIVPNQPPHASFTHSPEPASPGSAVSFDASGSSDSDGTVARFDWDFGDGNSATDAGPNPQHTYASDGSYQVTVTETDNEGCSTSLVFTGQTAYCNGSDVARATQAVTVASPASPVCPAVKPRATSFVPKIRPGHIVPGVRVRLATPTPARFTVHATVLWKQNGKPRRTGLQKLSVNVNRWRRVRFPIPKRLRNVLPLRKKVRVRLRIVATPRQSPACATTTIKVIHVRVVKVFPNAVQAKRPR